MSLHPSPVSRVDHHRFDKVLGGRLGGVVGDEELGVELWPFMPLVLMARAEHLLEAGPIDDIEVHGS